MRISLTDPRLSHGERRFLRDVAEKLREPNRGGQLPESYRQAIEEAFGDCGGDLVDSLAAQRKEFCAGR